MSIPTNEIILDAVTRFVREKRDSGLLSQTTPKLVRQTIEQQLELPEDSLNTKEYRQLIKSQISKTLEEESPGHKSEEDKPGPSRKRKREASEEPDKIKRKTKEKEYKSRSIIEDSDVEEPPVERPSPRKELADYEGIIRNPKDESSEGADESDTPPPKSTNVPRKKQTKSRTKTTDAAKTSGKKNNRTVDSEEEEQAIQPPRKTKKETRKTEKPGSGSSKHEETTKRYKSLISACGVRKPYAKIFKEQGIEDSPARQVDCLKRILQDLGMKGRMGLEQAKAIRARRELAEDIAEVQSFSESLLVKGGSSRSSTKTKVDSRPSAAESSEPESDPPPKNARRKIMAFLEDQSDSE